MTHTSTPTPVVVVVGGGITGLAAAWELTCRRPDALVVLFEAGPRLGGKISTGTLGGRPVDVGPDAFVARRSEARDLCAELGLQADLVAPGRRGASVWARGRLRPLPDGLALGIPTRIWPLARSGICSPVGVARVAADLCRITPRRVSQAERDQAERDRSVGDRSVGDRSVGNIVSALGPEVTERLADPLIGGIHAGSVRTMSAAAVFPPLLQAAAAGGSLMRALRRGGAVPAPSGDPVFLAIAGGMERLVTRLADELVGRGVVVHLDSAVRSVEAAAPRALRVNVTDGPTLDAAAVIVTAPAPSAGAMVATIDAPLAGLLGAVAYGSVALISMRFADSAVTIPAHGTGFLVPRTGGRFITACTWMSSKWPQLDVPGEVLMRASVGRYGDDAMVGIDDTTDGAMTDDEMTGRALDDLRQMGVVRGAPLETVVTRWPLSFPQYDVGHLERVAAIEEAARRHRGLAVAGAALHGVGIPACIGSGRRAAMAVLAEIAAPR